MLDSIWSTHDALQRPGGRVPRDSAWPAAFCSSHIGFPNVREQTGYYALQNHCSGPYYQQNSVVLQLQSVPFVQDGYVFRTVMLA